MSAKKGENRFKETQMKKIIENKIKVTNALNSFPKNFEALTLSKVVKFVSENTGLHTTTIKKNDTYIEMCNDFYLSKMTILKETKEGFSEDKKYRVLELENANLKNQIKSLQGVIQRLENDGIKTDKYITDDNYKLQFEAMLEHFKDQIEIKDGTVVDPYSGIRETVICKIN